MSEQFKYSDNYVKHKPETDTLTSAKPIKMDHDDHSNHDAHDGMVKSVDNRKERLKFAGFLLGNAVIAFIMSGVLGFDWAEWMRWFMGSLFIFMGSFKLIGYEMFIIMFPIYDPIAKRFKPYNYLYPFLELLLGFMYVANLAAVPRDITTLIITSATTYGVLQSLPKGETVRCACLGNIIKLPLSTVTLVEDVTMAGMALIMLIHNFMG